MEMENFVDSQGSIYTVTDSPHSGKTIDVAPDVNSIDSRKPIRIPRSEIELMSGQISQTWITRQIVPSERTQSDRLTTQPTAQSRELQQAQPPSFEPMYGKRLAVTPKLRHRSPALV